MTGLVLAALGCGVVSPVYATATKAELDAADKRGYKRGYDRGLKDGRAQGEKMGASNEKIRREQCEADKDKGAKKGAVIGGAGVGAVTAVAGGGLGTTLLAGTAGAVAGNAIGKKGKDCR
jgi:hypothetical protein